MEINNETAQNHNQNLLLKQNTQRQVKTAESLTQIFSQKDLLMQSLIIFFKERKKS